jgi:hypothetical protein
MRTRMDPRPATRVPVSSLRRRRAEQRARRQVLRRLDRLDEERRAAQDERH